MPELPEVETIVRACRGRLEGRRIERFRSFWARQTTPRPAAVDAALRGRRILALARRAKYIVFELDDDSRLLVHLRMSGRLEFAGDGPREPDHVRAVWELDDGERLLFCDARKFGRIIHTRDWAAYSTELGIEPLCRAFTTAWLAAALRARARLLKPLLLDQRVVAGLGNIYTDEALHRAGLHPLRRSHSLSACEVGALRRAIRSVLNEGIRRQGTSIDWIYPGGRMQERLRVYGRDGKPCLRCGQMIVALRVGQRGTHICPACQPPPNPRFSGRATGTGRTRRRSAQTRRTIACAE